MCAIKKTNKIKKNLLKKILCNISLLTTFTHIWNAFFFSPELPVMTRAKYSLHSHTTVYHFCDRCSLWETDNLTSSDTMICYICMIFFIINKSKKWNQTQVWKLSRNETIHSVRHALRQSVNFEWIVHPKIKKERKKAKKGELTFIVNNKKRQTHLKKYLGYFLFSIRKKAMHVWSDMEMRYPLTTKNCIIKYNDNVPQKIRA